MDPLAFKDNAAKQAFADALAKFVDHCIEMREAHAAMAKPARKVYTDRDIKATTLLRDPMSGVEVVTARTHDGRVVSVEVDGLAATHNGGLQAVALRALLDKLNAEPS